jgi:Glycosyl hydrolase family 67 N-terminus
LACAQQAVVQLDTACAARGTVLPRAARRYLIAFLLCLAAATTARAEYGHDAWLRYEPKQMPAAKAAYDGLPATVVVFGRPSTIMASARDELVRGLQRLLGRPVRVALSVEADGAFVVSTEQAAGAICET